MSCVKDIPAATFVSALASHLKKNPDLQLPDWKDYIKTSCARELAPLDSDWYFTRAASVARKIYLRGGVGTGALTKVYGSKKRYGVARNHFRKACRGLLRHILQQLKAIGYVVIRTDMGGRHLTKRGQKELDALAHRISLEQRRIREETAAAAAAEEEAEEVVDEEEEEAAE